MRNSPVRHIQIDIKTRAPSFSTSDIFLITDLILKEYNAQKGWQISIILIDHSHIISLNKRYFDKTLPTDVISFNLDDKNNFILQGEIYIDIEQAAIQAKDFGVSFENEIIRLTAHGVLHLLGFSDHTEKARKHMTKMENAALEKFARLRLK